MRRAQEIIVRASGVSLLCAMACMASGCLVQSVLNASGGGTMHIVVRLGPDATEKQARAQMESADVKVVQVSVDKNRLATYDIAFDDITKIRSSKFFADTKITIEDGEDGTRTISAAAQHTVMSDIPRELVTEYGPDFTLTVTLPGPVAQSNASETKEQTATWKMPLDKYLAKSRVPFTVTYKQPSAAAAGAATGSGPTPGKTAPAP